MESVRDTYSRINPDSPWRWAAVVCIPFFLVINLVLSRLVLSFEVNRTLFWLAFVVLLPIPIMWVKVGSPIAYWLAVKKARRVGGQRINSHPRLVLAMRTLGPMVFLPCVALVFAQRHPPFEYRTLAWVSLFVTAWGWERPWDLKVVERETRADEVTA